MEFKDATRQAKALAEILGKRWKPKVHENLGWFFYAVHDSECLTVSGSKGDWSAYLGEPPAMSGGRWVGRGKTPAESVADAIRLAKEELAGIKKLVELVEGKSK